MFYLMNDIGTELNALLMTITVDEKTKSACVELKDLCARFTTDILASCAFGVRANSLAQPNSEFRKHGRAIFDFNWYRAVEFMSLFYLPSVATFFKFKVIIKYFAVLIHETYPIKYSLRYFRSSLQISYVNLLATLWMNVRIMVWFETIWLICWFRFESKTKIKPSRLLNRVWVSILQDVHCNQKLTNI